MSALSALPPKLPWNEERKCYTVGETVDGMHHIDVIPMLLNHRVVLTPKSCTYVYDAGWCYPNLSAALTAVANWPEPSLLTEPPDYIKRAV